MLAQHRQKHNLSDSSTKPHQRLLHTKNIHVLDGLFLQHRDENSVCDALFESSECLDHSVVLHVSDGEVENDRGFSKLHEKGGGGGREWVIEYVWRV